MGNVVGENLVCWTLGGDAEVSVVPRIGLPRTMPLPDPAANVGAPMPNDFGAEGRQPVAFAAAS